MKYGELIQFDPIDEIIKFDKLESDDYKAKLGRTRQTLWSRPCRC